MASRSADCALTGPEDRLALTENTQPAILAVSMRRPAGCSPRGASSRSSSRAIASASIRRTWRPGRFPSRMRCGSSAAAAGTCRRRSPSGAPARDGGRAWVSTPGRVEQACADAARGEVVSPANLNGGGQVVIAGARDAVARAGERAKALGARRVVPLPVSAPFHCALMKPAEDRLAPELRALTLDDPRVPIIANVDALPKRNARDAVEALVAQVSSPVRWEAVVRRLASEGVTTYVEVGPGTTLSGLVRKIHPEATVDPELRPSWRSGGGRSWLGSCLI